MATVKDKSGNGWSVPEEHYKSKLEDIRDLLKDIKENTVPAE